jgi:hypothetical protein
MKRKPYLRLLPYADVDAAAAYSSSSSSVRSMSMGIAHGPCCCNTCCGGGELDDVVLPNPHPLHLLLRLGLFYDSEMDGASA